MIVLIPFLMWVCSVIILSLIIRLVRGAWDEAKRDILFCIAILTPFYIGMMMGFVLYPNTFGNP